MENVVLIIHLFLALGLIAIVLMQRSEGGGLGMGSGGGAVSGRAAATAMGKLTWILAAAFIATSMTLTVIAAKNSAGTSVIDRLGPSAPAQAPVDAPADSNPLGTDLLPPSPDAGTGTGTDAPAPRAD